MTDSMISSCSSCYSCACDFKDRPFEFNVTRVRGLNKPYTRSGMVFGNILHIIDHAIGIITFGYVGSNIGSEWIKRDLHKFFQYNGDNEREYKAGKLKFKLKRFKFKIYRMGKINKPFTRSGRVFGNILHMIDSVIGIVTFGRVGSNLCGEYIKRELDKFFQYNVNSGNKFKLKRFKFKIYRIRNIGKPFTRSGRVLGNILQVIDSVIGIVTFGHFDSHISHEWTSRDLNKLGRYIIKHGVENL